MVRSRAPSSALLSDSREVEQNFRDLDRGVPTRIAQWDGDKGALPTHRVDLVLDIARSVSPTETPA